MVWLFFSIYGWLGFTHCQPWEPVQRPPASPLRFVDTFGDRLFLQTTNGKTYCYAQGQWKTCILSPYPAKLDAAPSWLMSRFVHIPGQNLFQVVRVSLFLDTAYYGLSDDGSIWACSSTFDSFVSKLYHSGALILLLIPFAMGCWCLFIFWRIFIRHAWPVLWDWYGRGTPIK